MTASVAFAARAPVSTSVSPQVVTYNAKPGKLYDLIVARDGAGGSEAINGVTDDAGNTWTLVHITDPSTTGRRVSRWLCTLDAGLFTQVTVSFSGSTNCQCELLELTDVDPADPIDAENKLTSAASTAPPGVTATPTGPNKLAVTTIKWNGNNHDTVVVAPPGWTKLPAAAFGPATAYLYNPTANVQLQPAWTLNGGSSFGSGQSIVIYNELASTPSGFTVTYWDGAQEVAASIEGVWDGSNVVPFSSLSVA